MVLAAAPLLVALLLFAVWAGQRAPASYEDFSKARGRAAGRLDSLIMTGAERAALSRAGRGPERVRRVFDVAAATALLIFLAPMIGVTALAIRLDSPGPVLYRQRRIGRHGEPFFIYKFRSMDADAEKEGARWAARDDARITRVGRFIRKTRIDEIPQAINVLRGEMSIVGPRPERPEFVELLEKAIPNYHLRHVVKPGITGWAQVKYVYAASVEDARIKLQYDLYYIRHYSLWRDLVILLMTVKVALFGLGSR